MRVVGNKEEDEGYLAGDLVNFMFFFLFKQSLIDYIMPLTSH